MRRNDTEILTYGACRACGKTLMRKGGIPNFSRLNWRYCLDCFPWGEPSRAGRWRRRAQRWMLEIRNVLTLGGRLE